MTHKAYIFILVFMSATLGFGQLSPGDLTQAHANLEGMSNCTQCHDLGNKVTNQKCLECHDEIQSLINRNQGYHAHSSVREKDCFECHSEHHGRRFDMTRFDQDNFDHTLTGYELEGGHKVVDCRQCHVPDNIASAEIRKLENTFLGLDEDCLSCHDDYHQKTLAGDCLTCHNMEAFTPASRFDHDEAEYQLKGQHLEVDCIECHEKTIRNGEEFQVFTGLAFNDCVDCHEDPHNDRITGACIQCHNEQSFSTFIGRGRFNHNTTSFTLKGAHRTTGCFECHSNTSDPVKVFRDNLGTEEENCIACHEDHHEGKYGSQCVDCHQESSFLDLKDMSSFDHNVADYRLEGMHLEVDCRECHEGRYSEPIEFARCNDCHEDYHEGEFHENGANPDCETCHSLERGFDYSLFTLEQHQESEFPLEGAHLATPCFACHVDERTDKWTFRDLGSQCVDCHEDIHEGYISEKYYPENTCVSCHGSESWDLVNFDHDETDWPLDGKHIEVECRACHFPIAENESAPTQQFSSLDGSCVTCHENVHDDKFAIDGVTDCVRCHVTASWFPEKFDHSTTDFPLEGRHAEIDCRACHEVENEEGETLVIYKIERFECIDCHN